MPEDVIVIPVFTEYYAYYRGGSLTSAICSQDDSRSHFAFVDALRQDPVQAAT